MPRTARIALPGMPHHVTQRGNNRQDIFFVEDDRRVYLANGFCFIAPCGLAQRSGVAKPGCNRLGMLRLRNRLGLLDLASWRQIARLANWRQELSRSLPAEQVEALRRTTHTGRPLASDSFLSELEAKLNRRLRPLPVGRPKLAIEGEKWVTVPSFSHNRWCNGKSFIYENSGTFLNKSNQE